MTWAADKAKLLCSKKFFLANSLVTSPGDRKAEHVPWYPTALSGMAMLLLCNASAVVHACSCVLYRDTRHYAHISHIQTLELRYETASTGAPPHAHHEYAALKPLACLHVQ